MNIEQYASREAWLYARKSGIGGSDAAAILGHSAFRSPYTVWADKVGLVDDVASEDESEQLLWGRILEDPVRKEWERREKLIALPLQHAIVRDAEYPFLLASPDALVDDDAGLEIKTASEWKAGSWDEDVPLGYQIQIQHYLMVTGRSRWYVAALIGGQKLVRATIERNEDFIGELRNGLVEWWNAYVVTREHPPIDGSSSTTETIKRAFELEDPSQVVTLTEEFAGLHVALRDAKEQEKLAKSRIQEIENKIRATIGEAGVGVLPGELGRYSWKSQRRDEHTVKASDFRVLRYSKKGE